MIAGFEPFFNVLVCGGGLLFAECVEDRECGIVQRRRWLPAATLPQVRACSLRKAEGRPDRSAAVPRTMTSLSLRCARATVAEILRFESGECAQHVGNGVFRMNCDQRVYR